MLLKRRSVPKDFRGTDEARSFAEWCCFDQLFVCGECVGWYGDEAIGASSATTSREIECLELTRN